MSTKKVSVVISPKGEALFVYNEDVDLAPLGVPKIRRASHVEPTGNLRTDAVIHIARGWNMRYYDTLMCLKRENPHAWWADLTPVNGPILGPFKKRSEALAAEAEWLEKNVILKTEEVKV